MRVCFLGLKTTFFMDLVDAPPLLPVFRLDFCLKMKKRQLRGWKMKIEFERQMSEIMAIGLKKVVVSGAKELMCSGSRST